MDGISIITITFNDPESLAVTASSIHDGIDDWIVVDGSLDELAKSENRNILKNRAVRLLQEPDLGRFDAMNKGLRFAEKEIILFLNSGDAFAHPEIPRSIETVFDTQRCLWAVGQVIAVDNNGKHQWRWPNPGHNSLKLRLGVNSYCHQATAYRTDLLRDLGGFEVNSLYSDWQTSLILSKRAKPYMPDEIWSHFLVNGISANQTIKYWETESHKLRVRGKVCIGKNRLTDYIAQRAAGQFISSTRGKLIRPDLVKKYG
jgi:glycosyltransferase involved in cell wall biosynthesis